MKIWIQINLLGYAICGQAIGMMAILMFIRIRMIGMMAIGNFHPDSDWHDDHGNFYPDSDWHDDHGN